MTPSTTPPNLLLITAGLLLVVLLALSGWQPYDRATWLMEVAPVMIALPILVATRQRFPLTSLLYACIFIHALILMLGGAYTYARVPLGFQLQDLLHLGRNPYDKIGHFAQGFVPAMVARELLLRTSPLGRGKWLTALVICVCLAISATYELIEWLSAVIMGQGADEFLGAQGDSFDTQADMAMALLGAVIAQAVLARRHDRDLTRLALMRG